MIYVCVDMYTTLHSKSIRKGAEIAYTRVVERGRKGKGQLYPEGGWVNALVQYCPNVLLTARQAWV